MAGSVMQQQDGHCSRTQVQETTFKDTSKDEANTATLHPKKALMLKKLWDLLGLNYGMVITMVKGALPPTISIAVYQSSAFAKTFATLGYLVAIMSILSLAIMPRAKFLQQMMFNIIGICISSAIALLTIYCSVQARAHTTHTAQPTSGGPSPGAQVAPYNSSASAVSAIWLFFNIYIANTIRAFRPQMNLPVVMYSIFANVASTYAPQFATMAQGISFVKRLLEAFLTGFAIAVGVNLFIFPVTSRTVVFKEAAGYITTCQGVLKAQASYLQSLERPSMFDGPTSPKDKDIKDEKLRDHKAKEPQRPEIEEAAKLKGAIRALGELHGKLSIDLTFAKRELAYGNLCADDIDEMFKLFRKIFLPLTGMSSVADIFERIAEKRGWTSKVDGETETDKVRKQTEKKHWNEIIQTLHTPFKIMTETLSDGLQHTLYTLELANLPKKEGKKGTTRGAGSKDKDVEAKGNIVEPGETGYSAHLKKRIADFYEQRKITLAIWCKQKGIDVDADMLNRPSPFGSTIHLPNEDLRTHQSNKRQLYLILYMEFLLYTTGQAILNLVHFSDAKVEEGVLKRKRIIVPGVRRMRKWLISSMKTADSDVDNVLEKNETGASGIHMGDSLQGKKDPEHLPPTNSWQRFGNLLRGFSRFLRSPESAYGFRVGCATLSIGVVAYLRDTQQFFAEQRLVWAMIMVSIGMTVTAGAGVFGFVGRIAGTAIAMCTSLVIWYIVDGKTGGIIPMLWFFIFIEMYFFLKYPRFLVIALLSMVTQVLIIGYELEVRKLGIPLATSSGQLYYPIYLLAPYRLACVSGGLFVAFIWTFFPYPLTARSELRKDLGASLYLLANFYSCVHTTFGMRLRNLEGNMESKSSPGRKLEKARNKVFAKELSLLAGLRQHSAFTAWEPTIGGKFPRKQYDTIIQEVQNILNYMALISHASLEFTRSSESPETEAWTQTLGRLVKSVNITSHEITSMLSLLSASVANGHPLPPYLKAPQPYKLTEKLEALDADILSISHIAEPGYAAFAVMQIASSLISDDLGKLVENVKSLVGEVDFSFHVISTADASNESFLTTDGDKGKTD